MIDRTHTYFASDFHLGIPDYAQSAERERIIVRWLNSVRHNAMEIYLVGDVFDFWFEYKHAIPKGFVRIQAKMAELTESGIPVHIFTGNHDMWIFDYLPEELGVTIHRTPETLMLAGKKFYIAHGDALGPGDYGSKLLKQIFASKLCQLLFRVIHPDIGIAIAKYWSGQSRIAQRKESDFHGEDNERLVKYCRELLKKDDYDYFIFGHRHLPLDIKLNDKSRYINLGEWVHYRSYAVFDGENVELKSQIE